MRKSSAGTAVGFAGPLRALAYRFSAAFLILAAVAMLILGRVDEGWVDAIRIQVADTVAPVLDVVSRPAASISEFGDTVTRLAEIRAENERLRAENARLQQWYQAALRLEAENESLRGLLDYVPEPGVSYVTARVIADGGGAFVRSVLVTAGLDHGVTEGQAAIAGRGMAGRVTDVGNRASRVLLITDLNSRIPAVVERSRQRAVVAGDNSDRPRLMHLPAEADVRIGDRIVTSGLGGVFPPGIPIGVVSSVGERMVRVQPFVQVDALEHVQLVNFGDGVDQRLGSDVPMGNGGQR